MKDFLGTLKGKIIVIAAAAAAVIIAAIVMSLTVFHTDSYRSISISEIFGTVTAQNDGREYQAYKNMHLADGYVLTTAEDSYTRMLLDEDKYVKLEQQSKACFEKVGSDSDRRTGIRLEEGALTAEITKPLSEDEDFVVNTPNAVLAVRGTFFRIEVNYASNGEAFTDVYTYGGAVSCHRVMPDGTEVDEEIFIDAGYKACIKMDTVVTIYVEELIDDVSDNVDPIRTDMISDNDLVDLYSSALHGHELFLTARNLWGEIKDRGIDIDDYTSVYDGGKILELDSDANGESGEAAVNPASAEAEFAETIDNNAETAQPSEESENAENENTDENTDDSVRGDNRLSGGNSSSAAGDVGGANNFDNNVDSDFADNFGDSGDSGDSGNSDNSGNSDDFGNGDNGGSRGNGSSDDKDNSAENGQNNGADDSDNDDNSDDNGENADNDDNTENGDDDNNENVGNPETTDSDNSPESAESPQTSESETDGETAPENTDNADNDNNADNSDNTENADKTVTDILDEISGKTDTGSNFRNITRPGNSGHSSSSSSSSNKNNNDNNNNAEKPADSDNTGNSDNSDNSDNSGNNNNTEKPADSDNSDNSGNSDNSSNSGTSGDYISGSVHSHTYGEYVSDNNADCVNDGTKTAVCEECGATDTVTDVGSAKGHSAAAHTTPATCTEEGAIVTKCSVCGEILSTETIPANGHTEETITVPSTCSEKGSVTVICSVCDTIISQTETDVIAHTPTESTTPATCTEEGAIVTKCSVCGEILSTETIPANGHTEETITVPSTCSEKGSVTVICSVCETILSEEEINYADHTRVEVTTPPTCEEEGKTVVKCSVCGELLSEEAIPAKGHTEVTEVTEPTTLSEGRRLTYCSVCEKILEDTVIPKFALFTEDGSIIITETGYIQGDAEEETSYTGEYLITQKDSSTAVECTITVESGEHDITLDGVNVVSKNSNFMIINDASINLFGTDNQNTFALKYSKAIYIPTSGTLTIKSGYYNMTGNIHTAIVNENGTVIIDGGYIKINDEGNTYATVLNNKTYIQNGGSIVTSAGYGFGGAEECVILGGSFKGTELDKNSGGRFTNGADELECTVLYEYPEDTSIFDITRSDGTSYTYNLSPDDKADDGYYYVWLPKKPFDGVLYTDDGNITITETGFTQGDSAAETAYTGDYTITQRSDSTVTANIDVESGTHNITFDGVDIISDKDTLYVAGSAAVTAMADYNKENRFATSRSGISAAKVAGFMLISSGNYSFVGDDFGIYNSGNIIIIDSIYAEGDSAGIYITDNGTFDVYSGSVYAVGNGENIWGYGILNEGMFRIDNCSVKAHGKKLDDLCNYTAESQTIITGGSMQLKKDGGNVGGEGTVTNGTDSLELNIYDSYPEEITLWDGSAYTYNLSEGNAADSGKYYVWLPKAPVEINEENFPDDVFRTYVADNFDTNGDGILSNDEIAAVTEIDVGGESYQDGGVTSLKGIEYLTSVTKIDCEYNANLTEIDLSKNKALESLDVGNIGITELDVSKNTALEYLWVFYNDLEGIDLSHNTALKLFSCRFTKISELDVSKNINMYRLSCYNTRISHVNVDNNESLTEFVVHDNAYPIPPNVTTFDLSELNGFDASRASDWTNCVYDADTNMLTNITGDVTYTYDCGRGNSATFTLTQTGELTEEPAATGVEISEENFPDEVFRTYVSDNFDSDSDGFLSEDEIAAATYINIGGSVNGDGGVSSLNGIEYFTSLTHLRCSFNTNLTDIDISNNTALQRLYCEQTGIAELNVDKNTDLQILYCPSAGISELDVSNNLSLKHLDCSMTNISGLDLSKNLALEQLNCSVTDISELDVSQNTDLQVLECYQMNLSELNVRNNTSLVKLDCHTTDISTLDISNNTALTELECHLTNMLELDVSNNTILSTLYCYNTKLSHVNVDNNENLTKFVVYNCKHPIPASATTFDLSELKGFDASRASDWTNCTYDEATNTLTDITGDVTYTYDCGRGFSETFTLTRTA